jgi:hypothetical protein
MKFGVSNISYWTPKFKQRFVPILYPVSNSLDMAIQAEPPKIWGRPFVPHFEEQSGQRPGFDPLT